MNGHHEAINKRITSTEFYRGLQQRNQYYFFFFELFNLKAEIGMAVTFFGSVDFFSLLEAS
jgi:hypothetical protein